MTEDLKAEHRKIVSATYCRFLNSIDWRDKVFVNGIREGRNKFLSNAFLYLDKRHKYLQGDFYSHEAYKKCEGNNLKGLVYEHVVPKRKYIQGPCEKKSRNKTLDEKFILDLLSRYWKIAIITRDENSRLNRNSMPASWDRVDVLARYNEAQIKLKSYESWRNPPYSQRS